MRLLNAAGSFFTFLLAVCIGTLWAVEYYYDSENTVIGGISYHTVTKGETLLDIARRYGLGYNDLALVYPNMDVWLPPVGKRLMVPSFWVLPSVERKGIVLNIPELRLYFYSSEPGTVQTYPVGIGDEGWETPLGSYRIGQKRTNPAWYIPKSLQGKYGRSIIPPGPDNPLGAYIMKLAGTSYGIHGTNMPWGVGRLVSHGCIRLYPEHITKLFAQVRVGTPVKIIYEPIKWGQKRGRIYVEVHPDVYKKILDFRGYAVRALNQCPFGTKRIDRDRYFLAVRLKNGVPFDVTVNKDP